MDFTESFRRNGFKYRYTFYLGHLDKPESIEAVDSWEKEQITDTRYEELKRKFMKVYKKPIIKVEETEI